MKRILSLAVLLAFACANALANDFSVASPDGKLKAKVSVGKTLVYEVNYNGQQLLAPSQISMTVDKGVTWGVGSKFVKALTSARNTSIKAQNYKRAVV